MLTFEQRRKLEAEFTQDERELAATSRLIKSAVMLLLAVGFAWIGVAGESPEEARQASAVVAQPQGTALQASRQVFAERRARWEGAPTAAAPSVAVR